MLFDDYQEILQLWRMTVPTSGYSDPVWTYVQDITGRVEPINPTESYLHNQSFGNTMEVCMSPIDYEFIIQAGDGIVDGDGIQRKVIGPPEIWKWEMPHVAAKVQRVQWTVVS